MFEELLEKGIRFTVDAEELLRSRPSEAPLKEKIIGLNKPLVTKKDLETLIEKKVEVVRPSGFRPAAKEFSSDLKVVHQLDVTGKSRAKGKVENFVKYFRNRYERLARLLKRTSKSAPLAEAGSIKKHIDEKARIIVLVSGKRETKKGNLLLDVEDLSGSFKVIVPNRKDNPKLVEKGASVLLDDVVAITGRVLEPYMIAEDIEWPDIPLMHEKKRSENDVAIAYISDIHFGSRYFLKKTLDEFVGWLHGKGKAKELAGKVKYLIVAGDIVDGIGIYPNQERELTVKDITLQYKLFDDFVESIPDYIEVVAIPGNHDAVRRGEPMPAISKDFIKSDITLAGNPTMLLIEGLKHLVYHGTSIDSMIANLPKASYMHPEKVMIEYLKRRHLSPIYGGNLIIPENIDYMVIEEPPDIFHCGHVHKNGYAQYRGSLAINSGTFQARTDFQVRQGHVPTPGLVPVYETKYGRLKTLDFANQA